MKENFTFELLKLGGMPRCPGGCRILCLVLKGFISYGQRVPGEVHGPGSMLWTVGTGAAAAAVVTNPPLGLLCEALVGDVFLPAQLMTAYRFDYSLVPQPNPACLLTLFRPGLESLSFIDFFESCLSPSHCISSKAHFWGRRMLQWPGLVEKREVQGHQSACGP